MTNAKDEREQKRVFQVSCTKNKNNSLLCVFFFVRTVNIVSGAHFFVCLFFAILLDNVYVNRKSFIVAFYNVLYIFLLSAHLLVVCQMNGIFAVCLISNSEANIGH